MKNLFSAVFRPKENFPGKPGGWIGIPQNSIQRKNSMKPSGWVGIPRNSIQRKISMKHQIRRIFPWNIFALKGKPHFFPNWNRRNGDTVRKAGTISIWPMACCITCFARI